MKLLADRKALLDAAKYVGRIIPSRVSRPIMQNMKLEVTDGQLTLEGSNFEMAARISVDKMEGESDGCALVSANKLIQVLSSIDADRINIETDGTATVIRTDKGEFRLLGDNPDDFPAFSSPAYGTAFALAVDVFADMAAHVVFAASTERTRYALNGIFLRCADGVLEVVATDGKRLAMVSRPVENISPLDGIIVPIEMVTMATGLPHVDAGVEITIGENGIHAKTDTAEITSRLVDGHFPDYKAIIPKGNANVLKIDNAAFRQALLEGSLMTDAESCSVIFELSSGKMAISSRTPDAGEGRVEIDVDYAGKPLTIAFNPRYVLDPLKIMDKDIEMAMGDNAMAAIMTDGTGYRYIVMPVSVQ